MSGELRVDRLRLIGPADSQVYTFTRRVTVITGPVGTGKTSLLNAVKYALGGSWTPPRMIRPALGAVEIEGRLGGAQLRLRRPFRSGADGVSVTIGDAPEQMLAVSGMHDLTLSGVLLERLGLPEVRVPTTPSQPSEDDRAVTFADVLSLMYLDQAQLDGTIGFTGQRHAKWQQTFEVVYGFTTSEIARLQGQLGSINSDLARAKRYIGEVERFLAAVNLPLAEDDEERRRRIDADLASLERDVQALQRQAAAPAATPLRSRLEDAERALAGAREDAARAQMEIVALRRVGAQLSTDLTNLRRAAGAQMLRELEFEQCPRCMAALPPPPPAAERCRLCGQAEPHQVAPLVNELERRRLERQQFETAELMRQAVARLEAASEHARACEKDRDEASKAWDAASATAAAPHLQRISALSEKRGALLRARDTLDRTSRMRTELHRAKQERARLGREHERVAGELTAARGRQRRAKQTVDALGRRYAEMLRDMQLPDLKTASVHPRTHVPLVNDEPIPALSSGGMKTVASFAFFLAALSIRLAGEPSLLPRFMMIDSPRKGHGRNAVDEAAMQRFYRTLSTFARLSASSDFQVIVADNDTPSAEKGEFEPSSSARSGARWTSAGSREPTVRSLGSDDAPSCRLGRTSMNARGNIRGNIHIVHYVQIVHAAGRSGRSCTVRTHLTVE